MFGIVGFNDEEVVGIWAFQNMQEKYLVFNKKIHWSLSRNKHQIKGQFSSAFFLMQIIYFSYKGKQNFESLIIQRVK